jgi:large subunit ribosomal protein L15
VRLHELRNNEGARRGAKRRGRGPGSGHGKTSCRGHKGQKARSGAKIRPGFEGGQMPLIRRIPKRGFRAPRGPRLEAVNVGRLDVFDEGSVVDAKALSARGIVRRSCDGVKILGDGALTKRLEVVADAFSVSARRKIEAAKGTARIAAPPAAKAAPAAAGAPTRGTD